MELCSFLTLDSFITDPLTHDFMRKALLMSSLVAAVCGFLSSYLTLKGWALMGDAVSHSVTVSYTHLTLPTTTIV